MHRLKIWLLLALAVPLTSYAVPMEIRVTGTIVSGYNSIGPFLGTPTPSLSGYQMELRVFYDTGLMPPDTSPGPPGTYGYYVQQPLGWMSGTLEVNGVVVPLDLSGSGRISAYQSGTDANGPIAAFFLEAGDGRQPNDYGDDEVLHFHAFDHGQFSDSAPFDPAASYDFVSVPGPGDYDGLDGFGFGLHIVGDVGPGSPNPPRWNDGKYHVVEIRSIDDPRIQIMPVPVPVPASAPLMAAAFAVLATFTRRRSVST
jgi:hypothetical protein